jgi:hypothetical protein
MSDKNPMNQTVEQRSKTALGRVYEAMKSGRWKPLREIAADAELIKEEYRSLSDSTVSARIRDLRKPEYGGHIVLTRPMYSNRIDENGKKFKVRMPSLEYRLIPYRAKPLSSLIDLAA